MGRILYSGCKDDFHYSSEREDEIIDEIIYGLSEDEVHESLINDSATITYYKGESVKDTIDKYIDTDDILDLISDSAWDHNSGIEDCVTYLDDVSDEAKDELKKLIVDWATKHDLQPQWENVINVEEIRKPIREIDLEV